MLLELNQMLESVLSLQFRYTIEVSNQKFKTPTHVCTGDCTRPHGCKMVQCQGLSGGNAQLLAFPGRSSSLRSTQFHVKRNTFSAGALRGINVTNIQLHSMQYMIWHMFSFIAPNTFLIFCHYVFLMEKRLSTSASPAPLIQNYCWWKFTIYCNHPIL